MSACHRFIVFSLIFAACTLGHAATYKVDGKTGADTNDGINAPFKSIAPALRLLQPGDTLVLTPMAEPYRESIPLKVHGTPQAPIVIDGGGATISGADPAPKQGWQEAGGVFSVAQPTEVKFLYGPGCRYEMSKTPEALQNEQWAWKEGKLYFKPAAGKTPADYDLQMSVRISGILTSGAGQIIVRNLTAIHFFNDGFNIHSGSAPLWFENIKGLWNGDEGFSCHENVEAFVRNGEFSNNYWHGIADVGIARTYYQNITVRDNRAKGIYFIGGMHSVTDAQISGSAIQIALAPSDQRGLPAFDRMPLKTSVTNLRNVVVDSTPEQTGLVVTSGAQGVVEHCVIRGGNVGVQVDDGATAYVLNSIISGAKTAEVVANGTYAGDYNLYFPGRFSVKATNYSPEQFGNYIEATGNDQKSYVEEPKFIGDTLVASKASHAAGGALTVGIGGPDIGLELRQTRPDEPGVQAAPPAAQAVAVAGGAPVQTETGEVIRYDFEEVNSWNLIYPEPDKAPDGTPIAWKAELSTEQFHGGAKSGKFEATLPEGGPARYNVKLFSQKMPYTRPVVAMRFWLYGDNSGRRLGLRVRDARGECFYRTSARIDWSGWKQISWNLQQEPPASISAGDKNQKQDGPPMELVMDVSAAAGEKLVLYVDDLEVELAK